MTLSTRRYAEFTHTLINYNYIRNPRGISLHQSEAVALKRKKKSSGIRNG